MPWTASSVMEERLRFVARLLDGESMTEVCREFGISRKTGYKIFDRYKEHGLAALTDRSRRPVRYANQLPVQVETLIVRLKGEKPHWGARKIREYAELRRHLAEVFRRLAMFLGALHQAISKLPAAIEIVPLTEMLEAAATRAKK